MHVLHATAPRAEHAPELFGTECFDKSANVETAPVASCKSGSLKTDGLMTAEVHPFAGSVQGVIGSCWRSRFAENVYFATLLVSGEKTEICLDLKVA